jgi:hypothetical protein
MWKLLGGSKATIYVIAIVAIIGIFVAVYFMGRKSAKMKIEQVPLPTDQPGGEKLTGADASLVRTISVALHDDMKGWNIFGHNAKPYNDFLQLSDTLFVAVYNDFDNLYAQENSGTLRKWISSEYGYYGTQFLTLSNTILTRMDRLNLV